MGLRDHSGSEMTGHDGKGPIEGPQAGTPI